MNPYERVVDMGTILPTMSGYVLHGLAAALQVALAVYLLGTGVARLLRPASASVGLAPPLAGGLRLALGIALLLPLLTGAPWVVSAAAAAAGILLLLRFDPGAAKAGLLVGWTRRLAVVAAGCVAAFSLWELADPARLLAQLNREMTEWRDHEVDWQLANDVEAPNVGDLAPDFTLQDVEGVETVKLSTFRGQRPVALVFGSYT